MAPMEHLNFFQMHGPARESHQFAAQLPVSRKGLLVWLLFLQDDCADNYKHATEKLPFSWRLFALQESTEKEKGLAWKDKEGIRQTGNSTVYDNSLPTSAPFEYEEKIVARGRGQLYFVMSMLK